MPGVGKICGGISLLTVGNHTGMGFFSDECTFKNPQEIVDIYIRKNKEITSQLDDEMPDKIEPGPVDQTTKTEGNKIKPEE